MTPSRTILVTGYQGFIGHALVLKLLNTMPEGTTVVGIDLDSLEDRDPKIVEYRSSLIENLLWTTEVDFAQFHFSILKKKKLRKIFEKYNPDVVVHLAAKTGVRSSSSQADSYVETNILGFHYVLEMCAKFSVKHFIYASSSSVYGNSAPSTDEPLNIYAATKKADELLAYSYSHLYGLQTTGLRFFTVYGPAGRPDMLCMSAACALAKGEDILLYNQGKYLRDFTYIDDVVEGIFKVINSTPVVGKSAVYDLGVGDPQEVSFFVRVLYDSLKAEYDKFPQMSRLHLVEGRSEDATVTKSSSERFDKDFHFIPKTGIQDGLRKFARWFVALNFIK